MTEKKIKKWLLAIKNYDSIEAELELLKKPREFIIYYSGNALEHELEATEEELLTLFEHCNEKEDYSQIKKIILKNKKKEN